MTGEFRQSTTACCPRDTIPDSCNCPDDCQCNCQDCDCYGIRNYGDGAS